MEMVVNREKKEIRQKLIERLLSLTENELKRRSRNVEEKLSNLSIYKSAKVIMAYYPLKGEVDILGEIRKSMTDKRFCFPVTDLKAKIMRIFEVTNLDKDFVPGPLGIMEPDTEKTKEVEVGELDMLIVPGLGFDRQKNRLGKGGGFYDRFLNKTAASTKKVGIAFEFQVLENLPVNLSLDQKVDLIVSENFIIE